MARIALAAAVIALSAGVSGCGPDQLARPELPRNTVAPTGAPRAPLGPSYVYFKCEDVYDGEKIGPMLLVIDGEFGKGREWVRLSGARAYAEDLGWQIEEDC